MELESTAACRFYVLSGIVTCRNSWMSINPSTDSNAPFPKQVDTFQFDAMQFQSLLAVFGAFALREPALKGGRRQSQSRRFVGNTRRMGHGDLLAPKPAAQGRVIVSISVVVAIHRVGVR